MTEWHLAGGRRNPMSRRDALKAGVFVAGTAWVTPVVEPLRLTLDAAEATSPSRPPRDQPNTPETPPGSTSDTPRGGTQDLGGPGASGRNAPAGGARRHGQITPPIAPPARGTSASVDLTG
jgi:hypothetical protein